MEHTPPQNGEEMMRNENGPLHSTMEGEGQRSAAFRLRKASFKGNGLCPEMASATWAQILETSYGMPARFRAISRPECSEPPDRIA